MVPGALLSASGVSSSGIRHRSDNGFPRHDIFPASKIVVVPDQPFSFSLGDLPGEHCVLVATPWAGTWSGGEVARLLQCRFTLVEGSVGKAGLHGGRILLRQLASVLRPPPHVRVPELGRFLVGHGGLRQQH